MAKNFDIEVFAPIGSGTNFLVWWICRGKGYLHEFDELPLHEFTQQKKLIDTPPDGTITRILYCPDNNEYITNHPKVRGCHPFHFIFNEPESLAQKQLYLDFDDVAKKFCQELYFFKHTEKRDRKPQTIFGAPNKLLGYHINIDNLSNQEAINLDYKFTNTIKNKMKHKDGYTIDYTKFFFDNDMEHIKEVAQFIGFEASKDDIELITEYTNKNRKKIGD